MASENNFQNTVDSLFKGMDSFVTTKTVVGDAITVGDTILLPLVDVTFFVIDNLQHFSLKPRDT